MSDGARAPTSTAGGRTTPGALERGLMLGAVLSGDDGDERLRSVAGAAAERARVALARLRDAPRERRRAAVAALTQAALTPLPEGVERVHPRWISRIVERLDDGSLVGAQAAALLRETLAGQHTRPAAAAIDARTRWRLVRTLCAELAPMPLPDDLPPLGWSSERLERALRFVGCISLAGLLRRSPPQVVRSLRASIGEAWAARLDAVDDAPLPRVLRGRLPTGVSEAEPLLAVLGAQALSALGAPTRRALAQRLPPELGDLLVQSPPSEREERRGEALGEDQILALLERADAWASSEEASS